MWHQALKVLLSDSSLTISVPLTLFFPVLFSAGNGLGAEIPVDSFISHFEKLAQATSCFAH